jgi:nucleoside-diphosphate-sugar epimerase
MRILLTGGCGYIGSMLCDALLERGHEVTVVDAMWFGNPLRERPGLRVVKADVRDVDAIPVDGHSVIFNLANVANDPCSELDAKLSWEVNVLATMRLVEKALKAGVGRFIHASSGSVYGVKDEERVTEDLELVPISDYNKTKMVSERVLLSYADRLLVQILRPATVCGVSHRTRLDLSVNMLTVQALAKKRITVFGGEQTRPNIHIKDMVRAYLHMLDVGDKAPGIYNAGFENLSIRQIADLIASKVPAEISVSPSNDPRSYRLDSGKLLATGFRPQHTVLDGIQDVVAAWTGGTLKDDENCYNIKAMKKLVLAA